MSLWHIAWSYLWNRKFTTALTILSVALGVGLISTVLTLREETRKRFEEEGQAFDIVVGEKGNPLQLVLSTVYFLDAPTGTIFYSDYERLSAEEEVAAAFPIAMGDNYQGYRIVGTTPALFGYEWGAGSPYTLAEGRYFQAPFEAVFGAEAAAQTGLELGRRFISNHGLASVEGAEKHEHQPYTVVGILEHSGTPNDRAIFCDIQSVWDAHAHAHAHGEGQEDEDHTEESGEEHDHAAGPKKITAALIKLNTPALRPSFRQKVNRGYNAMAVIPVNEIQKLYDQLLGTAKAVLLAIGYLVVVISSISILIGLYMSILQRKRDLAIMRALGASKGEIFGSVLIEAFWVTLLGLGAGWFLGSVVCWGMSVYLTDKFGFQITAINLTADLVSAYSAVILMGMLAGLLPAWQAYRTDVARDLAEL